MSLGWKPTYANRINAITKAWQQYECQAITYTLKQDATHQHLGIGAYVGDASEMTSILLRAF